MNFLSAILRIPTDIRRMPIRMLAAHLAFALRVAAVFVGLYLFVSFQLLGSESVNYITKNSIKFIAQIDAFGDLCNLALLGFLVGLILPAFLSKAFQTKSAFFRLASPQCDLLASVFLIPFFLSKTIWRIDPIIFCILLLGFAFLVYRSIFAWEQVLSNRKWPSRRIPSFVAWTILGLMVLFYIGWTSYYTIIRHYLFQSQTRDLSFFQNAVLNASYGTLFRTAYCYGYSSFHDHFSPILFLIVPFYYIWSGVETLLILQSVLLGLSAIPLYFYAHKKLNSEIFALGLVLIWFLHPALHGAHFYDFHELAFFPLLFFCLFLFNERGPTWAYYASLLGCLAIKDDIFFYMLCACIFLLFQTQKKQRFLYSTAIVVLWRLVAAEVTQMEGGQINAYASIYFEKFLSSGQGFGLKGILATVFLNPIYAILQAWSSQRLLYLLQIFLPFALLPLFTKRQLILFLYGVGIALLATSPALFKLGYQYSWYLTVPACLTSVLVLKRIQAHELLPCLPSQGRHYVPHLSPGALLGAALCTTLVLSFQYGVIFDKQYFEAGSFPARFNYEKRDAERHANAQDLISLISPSEAVGCEYWLCAHLDRVRTLFSYQEANHHVQAQLSYFISPVDFNWRPFLEDGKFEVFKENEDFVLLRRKAAAKQPTAPAP